MKYTLWLSVHLSFSILNETYCSHLSLHFDDSLMSSLCLPCVQAGALENVVRASQLEIIELQHTVDELRYLTLESDTELLSRFLSWTLEFDK